ncbi:hypothetical protein QVD17_15187 [Tagetes erecta]|uniref:Methyltransferase type 11 domain-containing protein n=1 Tax=Tagetes erecta TaxID=13708 RepID=A0AAD8NYF4_TARER|nr:hypothetical protein QVD17_15187 [Tagetes erecta]
MELTAGKSVILRNVIIRLLLFSLIIVGVRFAYVVTIRGESCTVGDDFCFFSSSTSPENKNLIITESSSSSPEFNNHNTNNNNKRVLFYISVFQDLIVDGFLFTKSKSLCVETLNGEDVNALREINVVDSVGINKQSFNQFNDNTFDFIFSGNVALHRSEKMAEIATEIVRTLKPEGYIVVHIDSLDSYSFSSLIRLFNSCIFIRSRQIDGDIPHIHEIILQKQIEIKNLETTDSNSNSNSINQCSVPEYKQALLRNAEPLIESEPLKPWITLKKNLENVKYLPSMADISYKRRYVYVDIGSRSYGSSIVSWFKKQYPKQNKSFDIYAIEADKRFHDQYKSKKGVTLLPYAAWVRNESLVFEINQTPGGDRLDPSVKTTGMGRIRPMELGVGSSETFEIKQTPGHGSDPSIETRGMGGMGRIRPVKPPGGGNVVQGFDFAEWLKRTVSEKDYVVMKMDVEGAEFDLIPRLVETGAICMVDEMFLECHYNRWQKCCPGVRSPKYAKTYGECLGLFESLRDRGVLVHQWW